MEQKHRGGGHEPDPRLLRLPQHSEPCATVKGACAPLPLHPVPRSQVDALSCPATTNWLSNPSSACLLQARHTAKPSHKVCVVSSLLLIRKLKLREVKQLAPGPTAGKRIPGRKLRPVWPQAQALSSV